MNYGQLLLHFSAHVGMSYLLAIQLTVFAYLFFHLSDTRKAAIIGCVSSLFVGLLYKIIEGLCGGGFSGLEVSLLFNLIGVSMASATLLPMEK